jgi:predicted transcriptional regulator
MARASWLNDDNLPMIDEHVSQLEHFTQSIADGQIDKDELDKQEQNLIDAMKAVEGDLSDEQHAKVTRLLVELTAYNVMNLMHELARERVRAAFATRE